MSQVCLRPPGSSHTMKDQGIAAGRRSGTITDLTQTSNSDCKLHSAFEQRFFRHSTVGDIVQDVSTCFRARFGAISRLWNGLHWVSFFKCGIVTQRNLNELAKQIYACIVPQINYISSYMMFKLIVLLAELMRNRSPRHQSLIHVSNILNRERTSDCLPFQKEDWKEKNCFPSVLQGSFYKGNGPQEQSFISNPQ